MLLFFRFKEKFLLNVPRIILLLHSNIAMMSPMDVLKTLFFSVGMAAAGVLILIQLVYRQEKCNCEFRIPGADSSGK